MAATKLIAMHQNKGRSVMRCLKDRTDYAMNGEKTDEGKYISSYQCNPELVDLEFAQAKKEYLHKTWRQPKGDVTAYQIRQSFKPGEITPEEANEVGYETGMRFTKGKHAFIVATHVDRAHIHNHIIFNSTNLECDRKFRDFWFSGIALQRLSDIICLEHGLSVIPKVKPSERQRRTKYPERVSIRKLMTCRSKRSTAMTEKNLIRVYTGATSEKRIDIIIKNYTKFIGIVDGYTDGLRYMIECEKESSHRQSAGDLGVRVQTGGMTSDPTARKAVNNVITREALINCDFSGDVLDGVDQAEVYIRDAYILRDMRKDYNLFNSQLGVLGTEKETFTKYLLKEKTISDIAEDQGITYESARQQMQKIKVRMKKQVKRFMDGQPGGIA